jgi:hypothetical protein
MNSYPVVMITVSVKDALCSSFFGYIASDRFDSFSMSEWLTEVGLLPPAPAGSESVANDCPETEESRAYDDVLRDISSCEWVLYGLIRGSGRRYRESKMGFFEAEFATTYFTVQVALVQDDAEFIRKAMQWRQELREEPLPTPEVTMMSPEAFGGQVIANFLQLEESSDS